jgi:hypothetical protein
MIPDENRLCRNSDFIEEADKTFSVSESIYAETITN